MGASGTARVLEGKVPVNKVGGGQKNKRHVPMKDSRSLTSIFNGILYLAYQGTLVRRGELSGGGVVERRHVRRFS